jgi:hypothetical protein
MASKKLTPGARRLANPSVGVRRANRSAADGNPATDARNPADRDGNEQQARQRGSGTSGKKAAGTRRQSVARRRSAE